MTSTLTTTNREPMNTDDDDRLVEGVRWAVLYRLTGSKNSKAARLGVSAQTLDKWTSGASSPSEPNLARLARVAETDQETIRQGGPALETEAS